MLHGIDIFYCAVGGLSFGLPIAKHLIAQIGVAIVENSASVQMTAILFASACAGNSEDELLTLYFVLGVTRMDGTSPVL